MRVIFYILIFWKKGYSINSGIQHCVDTDEDELPAVIGIFAKGDHIINGYFGAVFKNTFTAPFAENLVANVAGNAKDAA